MILHIIGTADWAAAQSAGVVRPDSLATEGFTHCSERGTVHLPANRLFAGRTDLLLLEIDPAALDCPLRWEPGDGNPAGPWFPHVYGPIPISAVRAVYPFSAAPETSFRLPAELAEFRAT